MSKKEWKKGDKLRDPYAEYKAALKAMDLISEQIAQLQSFGDDKPEIQAKLAQYSMALVEITEFKLDARNQYNEHLKRTDTHIQSAKELATFGVNGEGGLPAVSEAIYHIACALESVFQQEPIGDKDEAIEA